MKCNGACKALAKGKIVVIFDSEGREGEADLVFSAIHATPKIISVMREKAGGLLCLATSMEVAGKIGLPFMSDLLLNDERLADMIYNRTKYGDKPSFSISINHKETKTGISDDDRSRTIREFGKIVKSSNGTLRARFISTFRTPGHVHLLIGRGLANRRGHTELSLELASRVGLPPAVAMCEITGKRKQMTRESAMRLAKENKWVFIEGKELMGE